MFIVPARITFLIMIERAPDPAELQSQELERVLLRMKELYAYVEKSFIKEMRNQFMGEFTQRALKAFITQETELLKQRASTEQWSSGKLEERQAMMIDQVTEGMFEEHWCESTLSKLSNPISAARVGASKFLNHVLQVISENPAAERFQEFAWIMFDVNGLRSFKDCTSHAKTTRFLQEMVRIFVNEQGPTSRRLQELGICILPMATGGDEFVLYLRGCTPITEQIINDTIASFQYEVSSSEELKKFLSFDDERTLKKFGMPTSALRKEFVKLSEEDKRKKLIAIRSSLPDTFIPSIAGGGALLTEGIRSAVEKDEYDLQGREETLPTLLEKVIEGTKDLAEDRLNKNKDQEMQQLENTNPKEHAFRLRGGESRRLQAEKRKLEKELKGIRSLFEALLFMTVTIDCS